MSIAEARPPLASARVRAALSAAAVVALAGGFLLRPSAPLTPTAIEEAPAPLGLILTQSGEGGEPPAVLVSEVVAGGGAARGGVRPGDVLIEIDGRPVGTLANAVLRLTSIADGASTRVRVRRGRRSYERTVHRALPASER